MNIKIQGGQVAYANIGSCYGVATYLEHEDYKRMEEGLDVEPFFNQDCSDLEKRAIVNLLDSNKAKLNKKDAKFFVITVSPSQKELLKMGQTPGVQSEAFKRFIREKIISAYANGFGKQLTTDDILYFAKIHYARGVNDDLQMHAHIVISRKTKDNRLKISPQTNHKKANNGAVKSGFDRTQFYQDVESLFDSSFSHIRPMEDKFEYLNLIKRGSIDELEDYLLSYTPSEIYREPKLSNKPLVIEQKIESDNVDLRNRNMTPSIELNNLGNLDNEDDFVPINRKKRKKNRGLGLSL